MEATGEAAEAAAAEVEKEEQKQERMATLGTTL